MLKQRAISATLWSGADIFLRQGLQFFVSVALARLLTPEEFGTIALLYLFTGIAGTFVDGGFSAALVQRQDTTHVDESTVFWFNLMIGAVASLALAAGGPTMARLFSQPVLTPLAGVMGLNVFLGALGSIHSTLLTKRLDFRTQMKVSGYATFVSAVAAITAASRGYGVWALAVQTVAATSVTTILLWAWNPWRPTLVFSRGSAKRLFGFGGHLMAAALLDVAYTRSYTLLIGKLHGVRELGFYNRADTTKQLPVGVLTGILSRVAFPIFSAAALDPVQLRRGVQLALRGMMLINAPMMLGLIAVADPLVLTFFGGSWLPSVPLMRILCLAGVFWPLHVINLNVLMAQGHSRLYFRVEIIKKIAGLLLIGGGSLFGVLGIAWSQVVFGALAVLINARYTARHLDYGTLAQLKDSVPAFAVALPMAILVYGLAARLSLPPALELITLVAVGAVFFLTLGWTCRLEALRDAVTLLSSGRSGAEASATSGFK